jgi:hypothetical protein
MITRNLVKNLKLTNFDNSKRCRRISLLGVGGVGSNLIRYFNLFPHHDFDIYDHDKVEFHNLNRTSLFTIENALKKRFKVDAVSTNLVELTNLFQTRFNKTELKVSVNAASTFAVHRNTKLMSKRSLIIDARDTIDIEKIVPNTWIKLAYDGGSNIAFTWLPEFILDKILSLDSYRQNRYEITPSFYVPAALLSLMTMRFYQLKNFHKITSLRAGTFNMNIDTTINEVAYVWE